MKRNRLLLGYLIVVVLIAVGLDVGERLKNRSPKRSAAVKEVTPVPVQELDTGK